jgi:GAF domain-containing protein
MNDENRNEDEAEEKTDNGGRPEERTRHRAGSGDGGPALEFGMLNQVLSGDGSQEGFLQDLTRRAVRSVEGADAASVMLRSDGTAVTVASSDELGKQLEQRQFEAGTGPCVDSMARCTEEASPDLDEETRWGDFPAYASRLGARSMLAMPLVADDRCWGALNLYSRRPHALPQDLRAARDIAAQAAGATAVALRIARTVREASDLRAALDSRAVIDQAIGIIMARRRCDARQAFEVLRRTSQENNVKLREVSVRLVTSVSGRPPEPGTFKPLGG